MIVALLILAILQDGPIRTAPTDGPVPQEGAAPPADPGPICTFGGRPVLSPRCPPPPARTTAAPPAQAPAPSPTQYCSDAANRRPAEEEFVCVARVRTEQWQRSLQPGTDEIDWEFSADRAVPVYPPVRTADDCKVAANRGPDETEFDCAVRLRHARQEDERVGPLGFRVSPEGSDVPGWAFSDPARWELSQCGASGEDACRRQARNRLALARAGVAAEAPAESGDASAPTQNCRMVMRRSESGFGGSLSRICGDQSETEATLNRLEDSLRPAVEPCDRPATMESHEAWIARCRALPPR